MRPIARLARGRPKGMSFGGSGGFTQPVFWSGEAYRDREDAGTDFASYVSGALKSNGVVFACILARQLVFSEARFQYQRFNDGRPGDLFDDPSLGLLERPWTNGTTGDLLARMEQDVSLCGNFFATVVDDRHGKRIRRLRPDWVTVVTGSESGSPAALDARVVGYVYKPQGVSSNDAALLTASQVCHWSPIPDPDAQWRGMSWITPVIREIRADTAATKHKEKYFENGATGGLVIKYDKSVSQDAVTAFAAKFKEAHTGLDNAYRTYHLGGGADIDTVGADMRQLEFKVTQGAGETRIAAAAGVGAVIAQLSEGLQGSSLNAGNFNAAKRRFADMTMRPQWRSASAALETLVRPLPAGAGRLWVDTRDIPFLKDDAKDEAEIQSQQATTIASLVSAGFQPDAAIAAVTAGDLRSLAGQHSGLYSVQLQAPGTDEDDGARSLSLVEMIQKIYLGVGTVVTAEEARTILNAGGASLTGPGPAPA